MRSKYVLIFAFGIGLLLIGVCEAKMYKWVDQNGVLHISGSPPPVEFSDGDSSSAEFGEGGKNQSEDSDLHDSVTNVIVFGRRACGLTQNMMAGLSNNRIPYVFQSINSDEGRAHLNRRMKETGNFRSSYVLPVVYFKGELMYSPQVITVVMKYKND
jgi:hypothetical protein